MRITSTEGLVLSKRRNIGLRELDAFLAQLFHQISKGTMSHKRNPKTAFPGLSKTT